MINETQRRHDNRRKQQGLVVNVEFHCRPRNFFFIERLLILIICSFRAHKFKYISNVPARRTCYFTTISVADPTKNNHFDVVRAAVDPRFKFNLYSFEVASDKARSYPNSPKLDIFIALNFFQLIYPRKYLFLPPDCVTNTATTS